MSDAFWRGVSFGLFLASVLLAALTASFLRTGLPAAVEALAGAVAGAALFLAARVVFRLSLRLFARIPPYVLLSAAAAAALLALLRWLQFRWPAHLYYPAAAVFLLAQAVIVGVLWARRSSDRRSLLVLALLALVADVAGLLWLLSPGRDPYPLERAVAGPRPEPLALEDPSAPGPYSVAQRTYGSGTDRRREEFGAAADWTSPTVDVSKLLPEWKGFQARARQWYWGFSLEDAPLNGRVWLPEGDGPFPLVLVVHGNHGMEEHSDPGYAYLGELLASRGFVTVSVDENYINATWSGDFRGREMPLRAVLLLEHLKLWRRWSAEAGHPMAGKVDLGRIALVGHSRGGEAIAIAAAFNRLPHFPDDASVAFDYGFDIQSLVAIAQTDARYPRRMKLANVSFLALQGSYDSDEASFFGLRQLRRVSLDGDGEGASRFKAGILVHGANHGQFNSIWGRRDAGPPYSWLLNLAPLIAGEDQRRIAKVFISAFLEATLHDRRGYVPLFRDPRRGAAWLPDVPIVQQYEDAGFVPLATFEEDLDVTTATAPGARIEARNLSKWREEELLYRNDEKQDTSAAVLGWSGEGAEYVIALGASPRELDASVSLTFSLGGSTERPTGEEEEDAPEPAASPDLSVVLEDASGESASVPLLELGDATPPLRVQFLKLAGLSRDGFGPTWEPELRRYDVPLARFVEASPGLDLSRLAAIRLRFDRSASGVVVLDDLGWRRELAAAPAPVGEPEGEPEPEGEEREPGNGPAQ